MEINANSTRIQRPAGKPSTSAPPKTANEGIGSVVRDVVAVGVGTGGAIAGGIYGMGEGLVKGSIANYPSHMRAGAEIGHNITAPLGGAMGAIAAGTITAVAAIGSPVAAVLGTVGGFLGGATHRAISTVPESIREVSNQGAALGVKAGILLGPIGAAVGGVTGKVLGGAAGVVKGLVRGIPGGYHLAKSQAKEGLDLIKGVPQFAKDAWQVSYHGGRAATGSIGVVGGGLTGIVTATGSTVIDTLAGGIGKGAQWAKASHDYISPQQAS